jgi:hypothetical protein
MHIPSWEASSLSASKEVYHFLWDPKGHYCVQIHSSLHHILNQLNPVHRSLTPISLTSLLAFWGNMDNILHSVCTYVRSYVLYVRSRAWEEVRSKQKIFDTVTGAVVIITGTIMVKSWGEVLKHLLWDINSILLYKRPKFYVVLTAFLGSKLTPSAAK